MTDLNFLTVRQPWAWAIALGAKDIENRGWSTLRRGPLAIHAGLGVDPDAADWPAMHALLAMHSIRPRDVDERLVRGALIAVVDLVDVVTDSTSAWAMPDSYHLVLANARALPNPIPYRGALGITRLADAAAEEIERQLQ